MSLLSWRRHIGKRQDAGDEVIMCLKSTYLKKSDSIYNEMYVIKK